MSFGGYLDACAPAIAARKKWGNRKRNHVSFTFDYEAEYKLIATKFPFRHPSVKNDDQGVIGPHQSASASVSKQPQDNDEDEILLEYPPSSTTGEAVNPALPLPSSGRTKAAPDSSLTSSSGTKPEIQAAGSKSALARGGPVLKQKKKPRRKSKVKPFLSHYY